ncbi:hypothetical protein Patl1_06246 [Pistacia atlantica]|uniref:Uncharacterized protein n=1 Tax=Pistacia atlantica TaxID=434234 RepID=A0ACC1BU29_9ROSI|nr:hypothetical protein Patl1_06246 [Pistacia atlantica]
MSSETCRDCINVTREILPTVCQNNRSAIGGYDDDKDINCMLRYADYDQFGIMEDKPYFYVNTLKLVDNQYVDEFNRTRKSLLDKLIIQAAAADSPNKYAADFAVASFGRIYGLVQCTPDLNETSCKNCLDSTMTHMTACCDTKQGGRVYTPSCNFRYALNAAFFKWVTSLPKEKKNHTVVIIVSVIVSVVTLVTLVGIVIFLKRKKWEEEDESILPLIKPFEELAWKSWKEGTTLNLIAPALRGDSTTDEMLKCIHIGLLCVQENVNDRPYMASVVHMLNSDILTLPEPSKPGSLMQTTTRRALNGETSSFLKHNSGSAEPKPTKNVSCSVDITEVHGR